MPKVQFDCKMPAIPEDYVPWFQTALNMSPRDTTEEDIPEDLRRMFWRYKAILDRMTESCTMANIAVLVAVGCEMGMCAVHTRKHNFVTDVINRGYKLNYGDPVEVLWRNQWTVAKWIGLTSSVDEVEVEIHEEKRRVPSANVRRLKAESQRVRDNKALRDAADDAERDRLLGDADKTDDSTSDAKQPEPAVA